MRRILMINLVAVGTLGLAGCYSSTTVERTTTVEPAPPPAPVPAPAPQATVISPGAGNSTVICPAGSTDPNCAPPSE